MRDKEIAEHVETVLNLYWTNQDWREYLDRFHNKEGIEEELSKIFGYQNGQ